MCISFNCGLLIRTHTQIYYQIWFFNWQCMGSKRHNNTSSIMADIKKKNDDNKLNMNKWNEHQQQQQKPLNEWKFIDKIELLKRQMTNGIDYCRLELLKCHDKMTRAEGANEKWVHIEFSSKSISKKRLHLKPAMPFTCMHDDMREKSTTAIAIIASESVTYPVCVCLFCCYYCRCCCCGCFVCLIRKQHTNRECENSGMFYYYFFVGLFWLLLLLLAAAASMTTTTTATATTASLQLGIKHYILYTF